MKSIKPMVYKNYLVMLEPQHNGSILAVASDLDDARDRIKKTYYGYQVSYIKAEMKLLINDALEHQS
jgi:hypothetical protein